MSTTSIEWTKRPGTKGATWNPTTGCTEISPGCKNCYARKMHGRLTAMGQAKYQKPFHVLQEHPDALDVPLRTKAPTTYFVNSMSDLFHKDVSNEFIAAVFGVMAACPRHTFLILTKRAERMAEWFAWANSGYRHKINDAFRAAVPGMEGRAVFPTQRHGMVPNDPPWPLPSVWLGVSVESQEYADARIPHLLSVPAAVRFVSYEPALGPVNFHPHLCEYGATERPEQKFVEGYCKRKPGLDWIIFGSESGRGARPCDEDWARSTRDQCKDAGVAFFYKQKPGTRKGSKISTPELDGVRHVEWPSP